jgi:hypothetical protein
VVKGRIFMDGPCVPEHEDEPGKKAKPDYSAEETSE